MTALATQPALPDFAAARANMIEGQIRPNKVRDERVLTTLEDLPRELFVPQRLAGVAYIDESMPVGPGRFLLPPMVIARFLEEAAIKPADHVLDIAPATGYSTAAIAKLAASVVAVESDPELNRQAAAIMASLEITNAKIQLAPMHQGWKTEAPYDVIVINGSVDEVPDNLFMQLKDGGRLVVVVRRYGEAHAAHTGDARVYTRDGKAVSFRSLFDSNPAMLPGFTADQAFSF